MKITVNGYEIEIRARRIGTEESAYYNPVDERRVLIDLSCYTGDAAEFNQACGCIALAEEAEEYRKGFSRAYRELERRLRNDGVTYE